jgi:ubiquinone/menaquinone biosynthesis C-methylase UbiE
MQPRLQRRVQRYGWDKAAAYYERYWQRQLAPAQDRLIELAALEPGMRVLDVACGTGLVTFRAAELVGPSGTVLATDISDEMVKSAASEATRRRHSNVDARRMDAEALDAPDGSFDVVLCALGLMYVPEPVTALREMRRVLAPGGRAVAAVWGARDRCGWAEIFPIVESRVQSDVCPMFFRLGTGEELRRAFDAAGFADVRADRLSSVLRYESDEEACGAAFAGGPVALAYSRFDGPTRDSAHADYLASIRAWKNAAGYDVPGEFVVAAGRSHPTNPTSTPSY